ncbi:MAG: hypothetical protein AAGC65_03540 [Mucilaginibacter sp.]|uniref:hypothetical protein n=1 Tax=Mucilaginibacter sp. TaxID=1882438 RepID=UPI0031A7D802
MNRLIEQKNKNRQERKKQQARRPWLILIQISLWVLGIISFFYVLCELNNILISNKIPLLLGGLFGLAVAVFIIKDRDLYVVAVLCFGSLFIAVPLLINDVFADAKVEEMKQMINVKNHSHRKSGPSVEIRYNDLEKKIDINENEELQMDSASYIVLKVNKGLLGYYIIRDKKLVRE